jgi:ribosome-binding factor A
MRSQFSRQDKVRKALMREVSAIMSTEIREPALQDQVVSVTDVELSADMRHAKVFISIMADEAKQAELLELLQAHQPLIRQQVGQRIRLRHTPEIHMFLDDSLERGSRISQLLDQISRGELH